MIVLLCTASKDPSPNPEIAELSGASFVSINNKPQIINGVKYLAQSAQKDWSIQRSQNGGIYRFEAHEGEARSSEKNKERSELSGGEYKFKIKTGIWAAYSFMVESGEKFSGTPNVLGQFHAGEGSPNFSIRVPYDNKMEIVLRVGDADKYTEDIPYKMTNFKRGKWYSVVIYAKFSPASDAELSVWIDGKQVVNKSNFIMGYNQSDSNYWKFGIYRSRSTHQEEVVFYANMELGTKDLSDRILTPKAIMP